MKPRSFPQNWRVQQPDSVQRECISFHNVWSFFSFAAFIGFIRLIGCDVIQHCPHSLTECWLIFSSQYREPRPQRFETSFLDLRGSILKWDLLVISQKASIHFHLPFTNQLKSPYIRFLLWFIHWFSFLFLFLVLTFADFSFGCVCRTKLTIVCQFSTARLIILSFIIIFFNRQVPFSSSPCGEVQLLQTH